MIEIRATGSCAVDTRTVTSTPTNPDPPVNSSFPAAQRRAPRHDQVRYRGSRPRQRLSTSQSYPHARPATRMGRFRGGGTISAAPRDSIPAERSLVVSAPLGVAGVEVLDSALRGLSASIAASPNGTLPKRSRRDSTIVSSPRISLHRSPATRPAVDLGRRRRRPKRRHQCDDTNAYLQSEICNRSDDGNAHWICPHVPRRSCVIVNGTPRAGARLGGSWT
jgi:hypothetical protein